MSNRLSHSSINKFLQCAESWRLHYRKRYRSVEISSALLFGSAIGKAFEYALTPITDLPNVATPKEMFDYHWRFQEINGVLTNIQEYPNVAYSRYDSDKDLGSTPWDCLRTKAHLMLDSFDKNFRPLIEKVWSTEEKIELSNDQGDSSIGYADAVLTLRGYDQPVIVDFKTAARPYEEDSVISSVQLSQYLHVLGPKYNTRLAGYCVFIKNIIKNRTKVCSKCNYDGSGTKFKTCNNEIKGDRCNGEWEEKMLPSAQMQLIIDKIPETFENFIIDNIENVNVAIKSEIFVKNINACKNNGFGRSCEFYNYCHKNSMEGLIELPEKEEK